MNALRHHLRSVRSATKFGCRRALVDPPNPGLILEGFGTVRFLYLSMTLNESLLRASSIRRLMQSIPSHHLRIDKPRWNALIAEACFRIDTEIEIRVTGMGVQANWLGLMLYEPDSKII